MALNFVVKRVLTSIFNHRKPHEKTRPRVPTPSKRRQHRQAADIRIPHRRQQYRRAAECTPPHPRQRYRHILYLKMATVHLRGLGRQPAANCRLRRRLERRGFLEKRAFRRQVSGDGQPLDGEGGRGAVRPAVLHRHERGRRRRERFFPGRFGESVCPSGFLTKEGQHFFYVFVGTYSPRTNVEHSCFLVELVVVLVE